MTIEEKTAMQVGTMSKTQATVITMCAMSVKIPEIRPCEFCEFNNTNTCPTNMGELIHLLEIARNVLNK